MGDCTCTGSCACSAREVDETVPTPVDGKVCPTSPCSDGSDPPTYARLTPGQARASQANQTARHNDRARQHLVRLGFRPYNVDLVFTKWTGKERGDGFEKEFKRIELTPSPKVIDLSSVAMSPVATGVMPMGSIRLDKVSACFTSDILMGRLANGETPDPYGFYYEVYEDGRNGSSERMKFRPSTQPNRRAFGWSITLERISADGARDGTPAGAEPD